MTALAYENTVPAYPLGRPLDGRNRYGMTPEQACLYRWLVKHKPHDRKFGINYRETAWRMARHYTKIHASVQALIDRGWLDGRGNAYAFVHPVMKFREARNA